MHTVNYNDLPQLRQLYELFKSDAALKEAEPHVEELFDVILGPEFYKAVLVWRRKQNGCYKSVSGKSLREARISGTLEELTHALCGHQLYPEISF